MASRMKETRIGPPPPFDPTPELYVNQALGDEAPTITVAVTKRNFGTAYIKLDEGQALDLARRIVRACTEATWSRLCFIDPDAADELARALEAM